MLDIRYREERARYLRAGLVAATLVNVNKRKGAPLTMPEDFIRERPRLEDYMDPAEAKRHMDRWATEQNKQAALPPQEEEATV